MAAPLLSFGPGIAQSTHDGDANGIGRRSEEYDISIERRLDARGIPGLVKRDWAAFECRNDVRQCFVWIKKEIAADDDLTKVAVTDNKFCGDQFPAGSLEFAVVRSTCLRWRGRRPVPFGRRSLLHRHDVANAGSLVLVEFDVTLDFVRERFLAFGLVDRRPCPILERKIDQD